MEFDLDLGILILQKTPGLLKDWLIGLPDEWVYGDASGDVWSPYDVVGHLVHGERTDWIDRAEIILSEEGSKTFEPFDRFAQFEGSKGKSLGELLAEFEALRKENIAKLRGFNLSPSDFQLQGIHPELGMVTLGQLLATWVAHDLNHIAQIAEFMARQYTYAVGPWRAYLDILED
jgi:hypothetical protein